MFGCMWVLGFLDILRKSIWLLPVQVNAAGSLTNTMLALARLSQAASSSHTAKPLRVAAASVSGCDTLGFFYRKQLHSAGVKLLTSPEPDSNTGGCGAIWVRIE